MPWLELLSPDNWERVQKYFTRAKFHQKSHLDDNIWNIQTITNRVGKAPSKIKGYLLKNAEGIGFKNLSSTNQKIELLILLK